MYVYIKKSQLVSRCFLNVNQNFHFTIKIVNSTAKKKKKKSYINYKRFSRQEQNIKILLQKKIGKEIIK